MTTLYLIRHGETDNNVIGSFNGCRSDQPLNQTGMEMAAALMPVFADIALDAIYSSPLLRARMTAEGVRGERDMEIPTDPDLMEMAFGAWEGLTYKQAKVRDPELIWMWKRDFAHFRAPGEAETPRDVATRMFRAILRIVNAHRGETVAVAGHGLALHLWLSRALRMPVEKYFHLMGLYNTAYAVIEIEDDGHFCIKAWNKRDHYKPEDLKPPRRKLTRRKTAEALEKRHFHPAFKLK